MRRSQNPGRGGRRPGLALAVAAAASVLFQAPGVLAQEPWKVALTLDDVPMAGLACTVHDAEVANRAILSTLAERGAPAAAFVVVGGTCGGDESVAAAMAELWRKAGHAVGNHSYSHPDYNRLSAAEYLADADRAHRALEPMLRRTGQAERWFRPPYLHAGQTPAKVQALSAWMDANGYRTGLVTIDNQEWVYARAYDHALKNGDAALQTAVKAGYLQHMADAAAHYRRLSAALHGREEPQVLLLHVNRLNRDALADLLEIYRRSGAEFVALREAVPATAVETHGGYVGERGPSWLIREASAKGLAVEDEPREAAWAAGAAHHPPTVHADVAAGLDLANRDFSAAWVRGDAAVIAAAYTEAALLVPPGGPVATGRQAIGAFWATALSGGGRTSHRLEPLSRRGLGPDAVLELGRYHAAGRRSGVGCYTLIWERRTDGAWRMAYDAWTRTDETCKG